jgi:hypothetical protein
MAGRSSSSSGRPSFFRMAFDSFAIRRPAAAKPLKHNAMWGNSPFDVAFMQQARFFPLRR